MIKAIISDFFGVIAGSGFKNTWAMAGGDPQADAEFIEELLLETNMGQINHQEMVEKITQKLKISAEKWEQVREQSEELNLPLLDYYRDLKQKQYLLAILSNANNNSINRRLAPDQLEIFDQIVVSAEVGMIKPDTEIFNLTKRRLGVESHECIFIDDLQSYVDAAIQNGMKAFLYEDNESLKRKIQEIIDVELATDTNTDISVDT